MNEVGILNLDTSSSKYEETVMDFLRHKIEVLKSGKKPILTPEDHFHTLRIRCEDDSRSVEMKLKEVEEICDDLGYYYLIIIVE